MCSTVINPPLYAISFNPHLRMWPKILFMWLLQLSEICPVERIHWYFASYFVLVDATVWYTCQYHRPHRCHKSKISKKICWRNIKVNRTFKYLNRRQISNVSSSVTILLMHNKIKFAHSDGYCVSNGLTSEDSVGSSDSLLACPPTLTAGNSFSSDCFYTKRWICKS